MVRVDDEYGVDAGRQPRIARRTEHRAHVLLPLALEAAADRFDHLRLNVFGINEPVRSDPAREPNGEPSAAGAEVGDDRALGNEQRVHDLVRFLPELAIGRLEETEILRLEQVRLRLFR